jgi:hypothetical protein
MSDPSLNPEQQKLAAFISRREGVSGKYFLFLIYGVVGGHRFFFDRPKTGSAMVILAVFSFLGWAIGTEVDRSTLESWIVLVGLIAWLVLQVCL